MYNIDMLDSSNLSQEPNKLLRSAVLFQGLSAAQLQAVVRSARRRIAQQDAFFFHQGDPAATLHVLVQGRVRMLQVTPAGQQVILSIISPGEMFGGIAILGNMSYPASAQALEDSEALIWDGDSVIRLLETYPRMALNALRLLAERYQELQERYRELATERVERRVARAVLRLLRQTGRKVDEGILIDFPLSREDLAELTGTTLYTVSRILSGWEKQGLIETGRQRLLVRIPHQLVVIAEDLTPGASSDLA
jgi:CRP-like cAMP-binding protein